MPPLLGGADLWRPAAAARGGGWATAAALLVVIVSHLAVLLIRRRLRRPGGVDRIAPTEAAPAAAPAPASASGLVHPYSARCLSFFFLIERCVRTLLWSVIGGGGWLG